MSSIANGRLWERVVTVLPTRAQGMHILNCMGFMHPQMRR